MQLSQDADINRYTLRSYSEGAICVLRTPDTGLNPTAETLHQSLVLTPSQLIRDWPPRHFGELLPQHFDIFAELLPEVVLLGCGAQQRFLPPALLEHLARNGIPVELMNTGAACRTYNILAGDGRNIAAALMMI